MDRCSWVKIALNCPFLRVVAPGEVPAAPCRLGNIDPAVFTLELDPAAAKVDFAREPE